MQPCWTETSSNLPPDDSTSMKYADNGERIDDLKLILERVSEVCCPFDQGVSATRCGMLWHQHKHIGIAYALDLHPQAPTRPEACFHQVVTLFDEDGISLRAINANVQVSCCLCATTSVI